MTLAMPQGIRRGVMTLGLAIGFGWAIVWFRGINGHRNCMLWGVFGVYRTVVQARAEPEDMDLV